MGEVKTYMRTKRIPVWQRWQSLDAKSAAAQCAHDNCVNLEGWNENHPGDCGIVLVALEEEKETQECGSLFSCPFIFIVLKFLVFVSRLIAKLFLQSSFFLIHGRHHTLDRNSPSMLCLDLHAGRIAPLSLGDKIIFSGPRELAHLGDSFDLQHLIHWAGWLMSVISALGRWRQHLAAQQLSE